MLAFTQLAELPEGGLPFPMPWASSPDCSFVETPEAYRKAMEAAGLTFLSQRDRREEVLEMLKKQDAAAGDKGSAPNTLALDILMGQSMQAKGLVFQVD